MVSIMCLIEANANAVIYSQASERRRDASMGSDFRELRTMHAHRTIRIVSNWIDVISDAIAKLDSINSICSLNCASGE